MSNKYTVEASIPYRLADDEERVKYLLRDLRRQAADSLLEKLHYSRYYCIRVDEEWPSRREREMAEASYENGYGYAPEGLTYRLTFRVIPVEEQVYEIARYDGPDYAQMGTWPLATSAMSEIKRRIKRWFKVAH